MKVETITFEYSNCGECPNADTKLKDPDNWRCFKTKRNRKIPSLWNKPIPKWCPLPDKEAE